MYKNITNELITKITDNFNNNLREFYPFYIGFYCKRKYETKFIKHLFITFFKEYCGKLKLVLIYN